MKHIINVFEYELFVFVCKTNTKHIEKKSKTLNWNFNHNMIDKFYLNYTELFDLKKKIYLLYYTFFFIVLTSFDSVK